MTVLMYRLCSVTAVFLPFTNCLILFFPAHCARRKEKEKKHFGNNVSYIDYSYYITFHYCPYSETINLFHRW